MGYGDRFLAAALGYGVGSSSTLRGVGWDMETDSKQHLTGCGVVDGDRFLTAHYGVWGRG